MTFFKMFLAATIVLVASLSVPALGEGGTGGKKGGKKGKRGKKGGGGEKCISFEPRGVIDLPFNAAFTNIDEFNEPAGVSLTVTSFFNVAFNDAIPPVPPFFPFERDLVARIPRIDKVDKRGDYSNFILEELTDLPPLMGPPKTVWPNDAILAPKGVFPFEALVIPQGFLTIPIPGRLTAINMDDPNKQEYIIDQSVTDNERYYHETVFFDMDGDGKDDVITVRSYFNVALGNRSPIGELVWFKNPGKNLHPNVPWQETVLYGLPPPPPFGPDIAIKEYDFDHDGVPEFVTTFFNLEKITIFGAPTCHGCSWADVDASNPDAPVPRVKDISVDQGKPFSIEIVDLNGDGKVEILATNHQNGPGCPLPPDAIPGRVYALEQPRSGNIFDHEWTTHVLLDNIRPTNTPPGARGCRLAPGFASPLYLVSSKREKKGNRPWIVVGGDEASKVWILIPKENHEWKYKIKEIFDIDEFYGPNTTQTPLEDPNGITISTIGRIAIRNTYRDCSAYLYIPVYEATDIHVYHITDCNKRCEKRH